MLVNYGSTSVFYFFKLKQKNMHKNENRIRSLTIMTFAYEEFIFRIAHISIRHFCMTICIT